MTKEQECIVELYTILDNIVEGAKKHDLRPFKIHGISGCDQYQGLPPICRTMDAISEKYGDVLQKAFKDKDLNLSAEEIDVMKHCIGLGTKKPYTRHGKKFYRPYRNRFNTVVYDRTWIGLLCKEYAKHGKVNSVQGTEFYLTRKGLDVLGEALEIHIYNEED